MSNETSQVQNVVQLFKQLVAQQVSHVAAFTSGMAKWNAMQTVQAEQAAHEMQKLTKETWGYMSDLGTEVRKAQIAAAKKGLAVFGVAV